MKKHFFRIMGLGLCLMALTACSRSQTPETPVSGDAYTREQPPELIFTPTDAGGIDAPLSRSSFSSNWNWPEEEGMGGAMDTGGQFPRYPMLFAREEHLPLDAPCSVLLDWSGYQPQTLIIRCWDTAIYDLPTAEEQSHISDYLRDADLTEDPETGERRLVLEPGCFYEIKAEWPEREGFAYGSASYCLITDGPLSGEAEEHVPEALHLAGGWSVSDSAELDENRRAVFNKALEGFVGVGYEPLAYLGSQVVAGTNHAYLCRAKGVYPGAAPYYTIAYIYEDLTGGVKLVGFDDLEIGLPSDS